MYPSELVFIANIVKAMYEDSVIIEEVYSVPFTPLIRVKLSSFEYLTYNRKTGDIKETPIEE